MPESEGEKAAVAAERYFAFVESLDEFQDRPDDGADVPAEPDGWRALRERRRDEGLAGPNHVAWLDCVEADYFLALPWLGEPCERGNSEHSARRRVRLQELDPARLVVVVVLLDDSQQAELADSAWHRIRIGDGAGIPVIVADAFDTALEAEVPALRHLELDGPCGDDELGLLLSAFSLDFLPDAGFDERGRTPPVPLPMPAPAGSFRPLQAVGRPHDENREGTRSDDDDDNNQATTSLGALS